tara:strand:- start:264 stop:644 length:381 start_codon:yes stop_codon:yes gene_type:complete
MLGGDNPAQRLLAQQMKDPFLKYFRPVNRPDGEIFYQRRQSLPMGMQPPGFKEPPITPAAADIFKQKTGKAFLGDIIKEPEVEPEVETLGKSESELSRRERLRKRRDASFKYASIQKQGGKALLGT